jgi:methylglutaconyl-CoA hydratase
MRDTLAYTADENVADARRLGSMLESVAKCACPVIARVHGAALGGGAGLVAACDIAIAASDATFGFTESRLGLAPAVIARFVVSKIGASHARSLFLTADRFSAALALTIGLVHRVVPVEELDSTISDVLARILANGPNALRAIKQLLTYVEQNDSAASAAYTASVIADLRVSPEGQEGIRAFLERGKPAWSAGLEDVEQVSDG